MATSVQDEVKKDDTLDLSKQILDQNSIAKIESAKEEPFQNTDLKDMDQSFYTKSMDLSDKDFDFGDVEEKKVPLAVKILLIIILIALIAVGAYFIYKNF